MRRSIAALACALVLMTSVSSLARTANASSAALGARILVHFHADATAADRERAIASIGAVSEVELPEIGVTRLALPADAGTDAGNAALVITRDTAVASAEVDGQARLTFTPNDPYWSNDPVTGMGQWALRRMQVDRAWDLVRGSPQTIVAVIDTGVDAGHPDLAGVVLAGATFLTNPNPSCVATPSQDDNSHGTHVAGIIGATANDGIGIAGIASGVRILPVKVLDCTGAGSISDIARGIVWATDHGARIINISLGSPAEGVTLHDAVRYATGRNVLVVAAAGNCGTSNPACAGINEPDYPAAYPETLAVGATTTDDAIASFSTQGAEIGVAAPGVRILSTTPRYATYQSTRGWTPNYAAFSGTSQAAPMVSGIAALLLATEPTLTPAQVAARLKSTADDLGVVGVDKAFGSGRVNAFKAVSASRAGAGALLDTSAVPRTVVLGSTVPTTVRITNSTSLMWSASGPTPVRLTYGWFDTAGALVSGDGTRMPLSADVAPGASAAIAVSVKTPAKAGTFVLRFVVVRDDLVNSASADLGKSEVLVSVGAAAFGATYAPANSATILAAGAPSTLAVTVTNTGSLTWTASGAGQVRLSYHWLRADGTVAVWDGARAPQFSADVLPGKSATVSLEVAPPTALGTYTLRLDLVQEGVSWFSTQGVATRDVSYTVTSGYAATYTPGALPTVLPGGRASMPLVLRNDGLAAWQAAGTNPVKVSSHVIDALGNVVAWDGARTTLLADVLPRATASTMVTLDAPLVAGSYRVRVDLVREGVSWFSGLGVAPIDVPIAVVPDYRATLTSGPLTVSRAAPSVVVTITNSSSALWSIEGAAPVRVAAHWYDGAGSVLVWDGPRTILGHDVAPGENITLSVALGAPQAGAATVTIDLVADGLRWFGAGTSRPVTVQP